MMNPADAPMGAGERVIGTLVECAPEFADRDYAPYPLTIVMDEFASFVRDQAKAGASEGQLKVYFDWVETLARRDERDTNNLVEVCFLEGIPWGELHVKHLMGPATLALARRNPGNMDPRIL